MPAHTGTTKENKQSMEKLIETIVNAIQDKKGKDIVSLDLSGFDGAICSHFVVCNADSTSQVAAIADGIEQEVYEKLGQKLWRIEGQQNAFWIAMDYVDVVVHIFQSELRDFYRLEELWADAPIKKYDYEL
jgi:ribosome-associated protein